MHPAKSVIFFTTASGAGYGLLVWLGAFAAVRWLPPDPIFGLVAFALALGLVSGGLISSTFHLGHPERAWRAMSQWRTSWLSREGVLAVLTFVPAGLFGLIWIFFGRNDGFASFLGIAAAVLSLATVYSTAMIYASLKTIRAWHNGWTKLAYLTLSLMTGALLLHPLVRLWQTGNETKIGTLALATLFLGALVKWGYWRYVDTTSSPSTAETATGLGHLGKVRLLDPPHDEDNYLMREMGYEIARRHAVTLRGVTWLAAFLLPLALTALAISVTGNLSAVLAALAATSAGIGIAVERWLFFAEARHVVTLYYGNATA